MHRKWFLARNDDILAEFVVWSDIDERLSKVDELKIFTVYDYI